MLKQRLFTLIGLVAMPVPGGEKFSAEHQVRELIQRWDAAYCSLDAAGLAALATPDFELVNRLGQWTPMNSRAEVERMWGWGFTNIYRGKPGPHHTIERVHFLNSERSYRADTGILARAETGQRHGYSSTRRNCHLGSG